MCREYVKKAIVSAIYVRLTCALVLATATAQGAAFPAHNAGTHPAATSAANGAAAVLVGSFVRHTNSEPSTQVDLTGSGVTDWRQWGGSDPGQNFLAYQPDMTETKVTGGNQISPLAFPGSNNQYQKCAPDSNFAVKWTDGSPDVRGSDNHRFVFSRDLSFTVHADKVRKILTICHGSIWRRRRHDRQTVVWIGLDSQYIFCHDGSPRPRDRPSLSAARLRYLDH